MAMFWLHLHCSDQQESPACGEPSDPNYWIIWFNWLGV